MNPRRANLFPFCVLVFAGIHPVQGQQAVSPVVPDRPGHQQSVLANQAVNANGTLVAEGQSDDGMGDQIVLNTQPRVPTFFVTGNTSVSYTDNAALTPNNRLDDTFFTANVAIAWTPHLAPRLGAELSANASIFRYDQNPVLDFQSLALGSGLFWSPENFANVGLFARYDFIEMFNRHSDEILQDHEFTVGAQRGFVLGRAQALFAGINLAVGWATPETAQRDQAGLFIDYRLQMTRSVGLGVVYRFAGYFYNDPDRIDRTQILATNVNYRLWESVYISAFVSLAINRSDDSSFNYEAINSGGGLNATISF